MPWLVYRTILRDLLRTLLLTAGVLVTVVAFGAAIKPLADDQLLTAGQAARYIGLAMVPMLQFALPFAAGFASTLLAHRMSNDNEVLAIAASGISYRKLLAPVAALGLVLLVVMLVLTQFVIPRFWGRMQQTVSADVTRLFENAIGRGEPFALGNIQIHAAEMAVENDPPDTDADSRMVLLRVVAAELDRDRRIVTDVSAERAEVYIYRRPEGTYLKLVMTDPVVYNSTTGQLARADEVRPAAIRVGTALEDDPMTMTRGQLLRLADDPESFSDVVEAREALLVQLRGARARELITMQLQGGRGIGFDQVEPSTRHYTVTADRLQGARFLRDDGGPIVVTEVDDGVIRRYRAEDARLRRAPASRLSGAHFDLELTDCVVEVPGEGRGNRRARVEIPGLVPAGASPAATAWMAELTSGELIAEAERDAEAHPGVQARIDHLVEEVFELRNEITGRLHKRYALSATAPLLLLLGATLAMWRRDSLPLTIYLWAFVPSILDLIVISGGEQMIRDGRAEGVAVLWSGNAVLLALWLFSYVKLARH